MKWCHQFIIPVPEFIYFLNLCYGCLAYFYSGFIISLIAIPLQETVGYSSYKFSKAMIIFAVCHLESNTTPFREGWAGRVIYGLQ